MLHVCALAGDSHTKALNLKPFTKASIQLLDSTLGLRKFELQVFKKRSVVEYSGPSGRFRTNQFIQFLCLHMPISATRITKPLTRQLES